MDSTPVLYVLTRPIGVGRSAQVTLAIRMFFLTAGLLQTSAILYHALYASLRYQERFRCAMDIAARTGIRKPRLCLFLYQCRSVLSVSPLGVCSPPCEVPGSYYR